MKNRAHMESREKRLARLRSGNYIEAIETLLNSIANYFNNEISITPDNYQTSLLFLGIHASILTLSEAFFGLSGKTGYYLFLEKFIDGNTKDTKFSQIANTLHDWRNVLAHQWLGSIGHRIEYDYKMSEGWKKDGDITIINPKIYCQHYLNAFSGNGKIWQYESILSEAELSKAKEIIVRKYEHK
ncbi:hypothetical protein A3D78_06695 [Candidatus Gottesmanbacteria bacterium RIFCSPHIGHO2_02_FULL_39_14]|uniref:Uncharacterized protein n=1 Tax=Candidatus Gottesmanbacteria bacterium RIFCSPHIGHO2_02_FULL_39_14 TaxID=1798383 RepID=A0A1F6A2X8_9BACT|nr:MAG: hypothetical protein A3D78_06695 [Candidatus Gottesmanbacteria bacterium RIFCSPHIGHO2_02_FULL_39_14]